MKTRTLACALLLGACSAVNAQNWNMAGNTINGVGQYLGGNNLSTQPLRLTTVPNFPIELRTTNIQRARLSGNVTSSMGPGNPFPNVNRDGFLLLSGQPNAFTNVNSRAPFTRLHLIDEQTGSLNPLVYAQEHGFRPWQRNGITFTGNSDQSYIGQMYGTADNTDFVIQWSDNPESSPSGTDRMKFIFTTQYNAGAGKGAATMTGMEAMRFWPKDNNEVNVGVGDFAPTAVGDPTERLDVLDGRIRFRDLPGSTPNNTLNKVMVVDDAALPSGERGVIKWRDASTLWTADCRWRMNTGANNHLSTAFGAADPNCPDNGDAVAIGLDLSGIPAPNGKLTVLATTRRDGLDVAQASNIALANGINVNVTGPTTTTRGVNISAQQGGVVGADNRGISITSF